jgi:phospholipid-binding lipoprotein MlaA
MWKILAMLLLLLAPAEGAMAESMLSQPGWGETYLEPEPITFDAWPSLSRTFHRFNMRFMRAVRPSIEEYRQTHSPAVHRGMQNFLKNLKEPKTVMNSFLELDFSNMAASTGRFLINTTVGIVGIMDIAGEIGLARDKRDFADTLGAWGVPMGGFFVLPLYAQTDTRDLAGSFVDLFDPIDLVIGVPLGLLFSLSSALLDINDSYDFIIATDDTAVDSYETFKTMYLQNRKKQTDEYSVFGSSSRDAGGGKINAYDFDME